MKGALLAGLLVCAPAARAASAKAPDAKAKRTLATAIRLYHKLDLEEAGARFDEALDAFPKWKTAAGFRAACRSMRGDLTRAEEDAKLGATLTPNDAQSYAARGKSRLVLKDYDGALADFRAASSADARSIEGPLGLGSTLSAMGKLRDSLAPLNTAVSRDPGSAAALLMRGAAKDRLRDFRGAVSDYGTILELSPAFTWARYYRAKASRELKDYRASEADFTAFLESNEDHEDAHYLRSNVRFLLGDYRGAIADLTKVIAVNPRKGLAYSNRGQTRALVGDKAGAVADLRKALELDPQRRDKIQAAIAAIEGESAPAPEPEPEPEPKAPEPAPRRMPREGRDAPSFGDDGPAVSIEKSGKEIAPRKIKAPEADLDDLPAKPQKPTAEPVRKGRKTPVEERHSGEEESLFIDK